MYWQMISEELVSSNTQFELVSIIIPTFNGERTIIRAVNSVLNQSYKNIEVIIVDDASNDGTSELINGIQDKRIKYIRHQNNEGGSAARNTGILESRGKYIAFLDDDDEWLNNKIEKQIEHIKQMDMTIWGGIYCKSLDTNIFSNGKKAKEMVVPKNRIEGNLTEPLLNQIGINAGSTLLLTKNSVMDVGLFDTTFTRHQDIEYLIRYCRKYKIALVEEPLVIVHGHKKIEPETLVIVKKHFISIFIDDINKLGKRKAKKIYANIWLEVSIAYAFRGLIKESFNFLLLSLKNKILTPNRYVNIPISYLFYLNQYWKP